jgi:hypothetical protein
MASLPPPAPRIHEVLLTQNRLTVTTHRAAPHSCVCVCNGFAFKKFLQGTQSGGVRTEGTESATQTRFKHDLYTRLAARRCCKQARVRHVRFAGARARVRLWGGVRVRACVAFSVSVCQEYRPAACVRVKPRFLSSVMLPRQCMQPPIHR